ncbi:hypothetical protein GCM10020331_083420 [Ectobacillus funiculus]
MKGKKQKKERILIIWKKKRKLVRGNYSASSFLFELGTSLVVSVGIGAKQDAWLAILVSLGGGLALFLMYGYLFRLFPTVPLTSYIQKNRGNIYRLAVGVVIHFVFYLHRFEDST